MKNLSFRMLALAMLAQSNYAVAEEPLKSPYFIDAVHCDGLEDKDMDARMAEFYVDEEVAKLGVKAQNQTNCEKIFSKFGIQKFNWVTPDDLEKLRFGLIRSGKFKNIAVRIEKSELQNHVHLKVKFEQFEPRNYYSVDLSSGFDKGGATGSRNTSKAEATFRYKQRGAENQPTFSVGLKSMNSSARAPLSSDELRKDNDEIILNEQEALAQAKQNWQFNEVSYTVPLTNGIYHFPIDMKVGLNLSRLSQDEVNNSNFNVDFSSAYQPDVFIPVKFRFSLFYSTYLASGSERIVKAKKDEKRADKSRQIVFAGLTEDIKSKYVSLHLTFNRSLTSELHYFYDYDLRFRLGEMAGLVGSVGAAKNAVYGAILPEHRFGLPNRATTDFYGLVESGFRAFDTDNKVALKGGLRGMASEKEPSKPGYFRLQSFAELGVKTRMDHVDVGLSFIYGNKRLY